MNYRNLLLSLLLFLFSMQTAFGSGIRFCVNDPCNARRCPEAGKCGNERISANKKKKLRWELLNLKSSNEVLNTNTAIEITQTDILSVAAAGNSWLKYVALDDVMMMNIGVANSSSPQTWVLPNNFRDYFEDFSQYDFISPSSVPASLQLSGTTHVTKSLGIDEFGNEIDIFDHYIINSTTVDHIGTSFDLETSGDDVFDEPDFEFLDVPLNLGDVVNSIIEEKDYDSNLALNRTESKLTVDAFGTLTIPDVGTVNCLRASYVIKDYHRINESSPFVLQSTQNVIAFISKQGHFFYGKVVSLDGSNATLQDMAFQTVIPTSLLTEPTDVKLNNDSGGVSINTTNQPANSSAILDISSDSLGVLIPRITEANRPTSPAEGLLVYQIDNTAGFYFFDGTTWQRLTSTPSSSMHANAKTSNYIISENSIIRGKNQLQNGSVFVKFDSTQDDFDNLLINIQLEGDCNGVYVSRKTREGFEVKELQKGKSSVKFSWSIR